MEYHLRKRRKGKEKWDEFKNSCFKVFVDMLKTRKVLRIDALVLLTVSFLQIYGTILEDSEYLHWRDDIASTSVYTFFKVIRIIPLVVAEKAVSLYWLLYILCKLFFINKLSIACVEILTIVFSFTYLVVCVYKKVKYSMLPLNILKTNILYFYWIFFSPIIECMLTVTKCDSSGYNIIDSDMKCYTGAHIFLLVFSSLMLILAIFIAFWASVLYQKTEPSSTDALAQLENPIGVIVMTYRGVQFIFTMYDQDLLGIFFLKYFLTAVIAVFLPYQYVKHMQYFDQLISTVFGFHCFLFAWIMTNSLLTYVIPLSGHFIIILMGVVPIYMLVNNMRGKILDDLLLKSPEKVGTELEAITQCYAVHSLTNGVSVSPEQEIKLIGLINVHLKECHKPNCPLNFPGDLYDPCTDKHVANSDSSALHKDQVFLKHFCKTYFEAAVANFGNCPTIRIAYASFLFHTFRNVHAALTELTLAKKSKPNIMQSFEIYKFEYSLCFSKITK